MGYTKGSSLIHDGLVVAYDAANFKSYTPGNSYIGSVLQGVTGSLVNGATYNPANGGTIELDGTDDYIRMEPPDFGFFLTGSDDTNTFTVECAYKINTASSNTSPLWDYLKFSGNRLGFAVSIVDFGSMPEIRSACYKHVTTGAADSWDTAATNHGGPVTASIEHWASSSISVVSVVLGKNTVLYYVNGVPIPYPNQESNASNFLGLIDPVVPSGGISDSFSGIQFGKQNILGIAGGGIIHGNFVTWRLYNRKLSEAELRHNYRVLAQRFK